MRSLKEPIQFEVKSYCRCLNIGCCRMSPWIVKIVPFRQDYKKIIAIALLF